MTDLFHTNPPQTGPEEGRAKRRGGLFVTDRELVDILGLPLNEGYRVIKMLDENPESHFPQKSKVFCGRRYFPAVRAWLDAHSGLKMDPPKTRRNRHE